ncbi:MAG: YraN family protein [Rhodococcus sp.]|nr:YraN family protein [Rhodococcus sp. (in: high G+C Gram-positive bacteria)]
MAENMTLGAEGEQIAADFLTTQGMEIVERNWRSRNGEIDLIARDGHHLVFIEVKTRSGTGYGLPSEAVTAAKQRRIRMLAIEWLRSSGNYWQRIRFDVVSVLVHRGRNRGSEASGEQPVIEHIADAF